MDAAGQAPANFGNYAKANAIVPPQMSALDSISVRIKELQARAVDSLQRLGAISDRAFGEQPTQPGKSSVAPVRSGGTGLILNQLDDLESTLIGITEQASRFGQL